MENYHEQEQMPNQQVPLKEQFFIWALLIIIAAVFLFIAFYLLKLAIDNTYYHPHILSVCIAFISLRGAYYFSSLITPYVNRNRDFLNAIAFLFCCIITIVSLLFFTSLIFTI